MRVPGSITRRSDALSTVMWRMVVVQRRRTKKEFRCAASTSPLRFGARAVLCSLLPWFLAACMSQATAGKIMVASGGVLVGLGALNAAGAFGGSCENDPAGQTSCGSSGTPDGGSMATIGVGAAVAATGAVLWALSPKNAAPHPAPSSASHVVPQPTVQSARGYDVLNQLAPRWFVMGNVHQRPPLVLVQSRTTLCWLRGPMTRGDLRRVVGVEGGASAR
jgi:hypothetical protein